MTRQHAQLVMRTCLGWRGCLVSSTAPAHSLTSSYYVITLHLFSFPPFPPHLSPSPTRTPHEPSRTLSHTRTLTHTHTHTHTHTLPVSIRPPLNPFRAGKKHAPGAAPGRHLLRQRSRPGGGGGHEPRHWATVLQTDVRVRPFVGEAVGRGGGGDELWYAGERHV